MPTSNSTQQTNRYLEILGILCFAISLFLALALLSYHLYDPASSNGVLTGSGNWMGPVGTKISAFLTDLLGFASWWLPIAFFLGAVFLFFPDKFHAPNPFLFTIGSIFLIIASSAFLSLLGYTIASKSSWGGIIGILLFEGITGAVGILGAYLICFVFILASIMLITPFSPINMLKKLSLFLKNIRHRPEKDVPSQQIPKKSKPKAPNQQLTDEPSYPKIVPTQPKQERGEEEPEPEESDFKVASPTGDFQLPSLSFLNDPDHTDVAQDNEEYYANATILEQKLLDFGVAGKVVQICPGPVVTMYEFAPAPGVKINKVASLADDLALALKTHSVRIVAPIPGKGVIGIELANPVRQTVYLKEILASDLFLKKNWVLPLALGKDIMGEPYITDLAKMPHLLIAGATGAGKSVGLNSMICSLLYKHKPADLRMLMIDPKRIELSLYDGIPHLIHPVVSDAKEATRALRWAVLEMERRYQLLEEARARNVANYNKNAEEPIPLLVIIIDELADLMMVSSKEVEAAIARLAQMARAAAIHLIIATQRPSVDVLTGLIKANFPARISFKVSSKVDSRTIIDQGGAERLLGMGDMLFLPPGASSLVRIHGCYVSEPEISKIVEFLKEQAEPEYESSVIEPIPGEEGSGRAGKGGDDVDERYDEAVEIVTQSGNASISMLQRRLRVGYNRAARMIEQMEADGIVTPVDLKGRRQVIVKGYEDEQ